MRFVFGYDASPGLVQQADALDESEYTRLEREADRVFSGKRRAKQPRIREQIVRERGFNNCCRPSGSGDFAPGLRSA